MKKISKLMTAALIALASFVPAQAETLTVNNGSDYLGAVPFNSLWVDTEGYKTQVLYPAADLTAMVGKDIKAITFYTEPEGLTINGGLFNISMGETDATLMSSFVTEGMTQVGTCTFNAHEGEVVEYTITFDTPYRYNGGNLIFENVVAVETGMASTYWTGVKISYNNCVQGNGSPNFQQFLPKTTFTYGSDEPVEITSYTVVGPGSIFGSNWNTEDTSNDMVLDEATGIYSWNKKDVALYGNFDFKVVGNHSYEIYEWPVGPYNWTANVPEEGMYSIAITFDPNAEEDYRITCTLVKTGDIAPVEHTYTVAGTENLFGSNWAPGDADNDMVKGDDGIYTWAKNNVTFAEPAAIEFKVVQDHSWDYAWPSSNWHYDITEAGTYDFVITFNAETKEITFTANKHGEPQGLRGDVNNDEAVNISDVTALIDYLLSQDATNVNLVNADCNLDQAVNISDVTALIDYLLSQAWPAK